MTWLVGYILQQKPVLFSILELGPTGTTVIRPLSAPQWLTVSTSAKVMSSSQCPFRMASLFSCWISGTPACTAGLTMATMAMMQSYQNSSKINWRMCIVTLVGMLRQNIDQICVNFDFGPYHILQQRHPGPVGFLYCRWLMSDSRKPWKRSQPPPTFGRFAVHPVLSAPADCSDSSATQDENSWKYQAMSIM